MKVFYNLFLFAALFIVAQAGFSQGTVTGTVLDSELGEPLPGANILVKGTTNGTTTDFEGNFTVNVSQNTGTLVISYIGFLKKEVPFTISGGTANVGSVSLEADAQELEGVVVVGTGIIDLARDRQTPIAVSSIPATEIQTKAVGNVEFPEAMKNTPNVYVANQAGGFGDSQMFLRGFSQANTAFLLNGQPINGMEDGLMYWSNWSGMADVANGIQIQRGLGSSKLAISSVGGTVNIVSKAAERKEGGFIRTMTGNDSYAKATFSYDSGLKGKWAYSVLIDHWQAHRKYAEGTAGQGQNYFIAVGYVPNEDHSINFLLTGAPQWHDQNFSKDLELYEEYGEKYNNNSGFLNGERFSWRRNYYHKPVANLNWDWKVNEELELSSVLYASWGRGGGTGSVGATNIFDGNGRVDFDAIEESNIANADTNGYGGFGDVGMLRSSVNNHNWYGFLSNLEFNPDEKWSINVGADTRFYRGSHWQQLVNKLGVNGYLNNDRTDRSSDYVITETFEANPWSALFDYADEDQRYNYDYSENINYYGGFGQVEYKLDNLSAFIQAAVSNQTYQREGRLSGFGDGEGKSDKLDRLGFNVKGGVGYSINDKSTFYANAGYYSRQAFLDNIFTNIRYSNEVVEPEVDNEEITGLEGGYRFTGGDFNVNVNAYYTKWGNRFLASIGEDVVNGETVDVRTRYTDITQVHKGVEVDVKFRPSSDFMFRWHGTIGNWEYDGTTPFITQNDETAATIAEGEVDLTGTKIGNAPQVSTGFGTNINIFDRLSISADLNIYTDLYGFVSTEDVINASISGERFQSERLSPYTLTDIGATYKFSLGENELVLLGNVYNLWNQSYINQKDQYGYFFGIGRTWNLSLRYNF